MNKLKAFKLTNVDVKTASSEILVNNGCTIGIELDTAVLQSSLYNLFYAQNPILQGLNDEDKEFLCNFIAGYTRSILHWDLVRYQKSDLIDRLKDGAIYEEFTVKSFGKPLDFLTGITHVNAKDGSKFIISFKLPHDAVVHLYMVLKRIEAISEDMNKDNHESVMAILNTYLPALTQYFLPKF